MNKLMLLVAFFLFTIGMSAQKVMEKDVPKPATAGFFKAHPTAKDVEWHRMGKNYKAGFEEGEVKMYSTYSDEGKLIEHGMGIVQTALPYPVMEYVKNTYKEDEVKNACKVIDASGVVTYDVEVKGMDVTFDAMGNYMKSVKK
jgi:hypothetical protein